ncbi:solute carrier organic anion transporter family member 2B1, partial [Biomphalaria pfeifferi]
MNRTEYKPVSDSRKDWRDGFRDGPKRDTLCGILSVTPEVIQPCASMSCFTAFYGMAALLTSTLSIYVNSQ